MDRRHLVPFARAELAEQIGCADGYVRRLRGHVVTCHDLPERVNGKDGKSYPAHYSPPTIPPQVMRTHNLNFNVTKSTVWTLSTPVDMTMSRRMKSAIVDVLAVLPLAIAAPASAVIRRIWPGFRHG